MADIIQDVEGVGIMGACWLLGECGDGKSHISSVVVFFEECVELGSHLRMTGCWLPIEAYEFDRRRN